MVDEKLEEIIATMRKLPLYGSVNHPDDYDFEWPTKTDLRAMPKNMPIKAWGFNWDHSSKHGAMIGGI